MEEIKINNNNYDRPKDLDLSFAVMVNEAKENPNLSKEVYVDLYDKQKKNVRVSKKKKKQANLKRNFKRGLVIAGVTFISIASATAARINVGKRNIDEVLESHKSVEWFDDARYWTLDGKLMDSWHNQASYEDTLETLINGLVNESGISVDIAAMKLNGMGFDNRNFNETCARMGMEGTTFLGRMEAASDLALAEDVEEFKAEFLQERGVSK